jgi:hypothetical protein
VLRALFHEILALALAPRGFQARPRAHKPHAAQGDDTTHHLWNFIEDHGEIVFPLLGLAIAAILFLGIRRGMKSNVAELKEKQERKDAIVRMMRAKLLVSADVVAGELQIDKFLAASLLDELVREGKLVEQRMVGGIANYRLKGL